MTAFRRGVQARKKRDAELAKRRAAARTGAGFFSAEEAFAEVAIENGSWNWALVGPNPDKLELSAGGRLGIEQMEDALANHPCLFGMYRSQFVDPASKEKATKFVFIQASNMDEEHSGYSQLQRGQAIAAGPKIAAIVDKYAKTVGKLAIKSKEECTVAHLIEGLASLVKGQADEKLITAEAYELGVQNYKEALPEHFKPAQEARAQEAVQMAEEEAPRSEVAEETAQQDLDPFLTSAPASPVNRTSKDSAPAAVEAPPAVSEGSSRQRKAVKLYRVGDVVDVWSGRNQDWIIDGEVVAATDETIQVHGTKVSAGSVKVIYSRGQMYKWIPPAKFGELLRESLRPRPPDGHKGTMLKQTHGFVSEWNERYFELRKGHLQWWENEEAAKKGTPGRAIYLLGANIQELETSFRLLSDGTKGVIYHFDAGSRESMVLWAETAWAHAEYCEEMRELAKAARSGREAREELMEAFAAKRLTRQSARQSARVSDKLLIVTA